MLLIKCERPGCTALPSQTQYLVKNAARVKSLRCEIFAIDLSSGLRSLFPISSPCDRWDVSLRIIRIGFVLRLLSAPVEAMPAPACMNTRHHGVHLGGRCDRECAILYCCGAQIWCADCYGAPTNLAGNSSIYYIESIQLSQSARLTCRPEMRVSRLS